MEPSHAFADALLYTCLLFGVALYLAVIINKFQKKIKEEIMDTNKHTVSGKTRTLQASWSVDYDNSDYIYSVNHTRKSLKSWLKVEGLKPKWFGLESKKSMVKRLDKRFADTFANAIREEIDKEILECINAEVTQLAE